VGKENMVKELFSVLSWFIPKLPVIYSLHWGPTLHPIPVHLHEKFDSTNTYPGWYEADVCIENISSRTLGSLRIKICRKHCAPPMVSEGRKNYREWEFDESKDEITIRNLDPKTKLIIQFFLAFDDKGGEIEPQIIVDGELHSKVQNFIAGWITFVKGRFGIIFSGVMLPIFGFLFYVYSTVIFPCTFQNSDSCRLSRASERISSYCQLAVEKVKSNTLDKVRSSGFPLDLTLFINKAKSTDVLLEQDKIVICDFPHVQQ
jgi:hypothetical protein